MSSTDKLKYIPFSIGTICRILITYTVQQEKPVEPDLVPRDVLDKLSIFNCKTDQLNKILVLYDPLTS